MTSRKLFGWGPVLLLATVVFGFGAGMAMGGDMGDEVRKTCGSCHSVSRMCDLLGERSKAGWKLTVRNMVARGAKVTTGNIEPLAEYLAGLKPGDPAVCD